MGDISKHFSRSEFACRCGCGFDTVDIELIKVLEDLYIHFQIIYQCIYVQICGPNRCEKHNLSIKNSSPLSKHLIGQASDIKVKYKNNSSLLQVDPELVGSYLEAEYPNKYGIGKYYNRTHVDIRKHEARWNRR